MTRRNPRKPNRRSLLTPDMRKQLVDNTLMGAPVPLVAASVGISIRTLQDWMQRGAQEQERLDDLMEAGEDDPVVDRTMRPFLELYADLTKARAKAAVRNVGYVQKVAMGGFVTEETIKKYRDENGRPVEETTVKKAAPDWRASAWYLERQQRGLFGKDATQVEIVQGVGESEGALPALTAEEAAGLSDRMRENLAILAAAREQITAGDDSIVDAEVVEEG